VVKGLEQLLSEAVLRRHAGARAFARGEDYFRRGAVHSLEQSERSAKAIVRGQNDYEVELAMVEGALHSYCDCPMGEQGDFCKHLVALGLTLIGIKQPKQTVDVITDQEVIRAIVSEDPKDLAMQLLEWAQSDEQLDERLRQFAALKKGPTAALGLAEDALLKAFRIRGFLHYREASGWARQVNVAIDQLEALLRLGEFYGVIELCEKSLGVLDGTMESMDDSDGHLTNIRERLQGIHFAASSAANPDPVALAKRLFDFALSSELEIFIDGAEQYKEILGPEGMSRYKELAEAEWALVPVSKSRSENFEHFRIRFIMESLAKASGDVEALVAVKKKNLSSGYDYLQISQVYREAKEHDKALEWAERGLKAFGKPADSRLREFAAQEYARLHRHADALEMVWANFTDSPQINTYSRLEAFASLSGEWPLWRAKALERIRKVSTIDRSTLIEIAIYEKDLGWAWKEAEEGGCHSGLWLNLAERSLDQYPEKAGPVMLKLAQEKILRPNNSKYEDSVRLLIVAAGAMAKAGLSDHFEAELDRLKLKFKPKRNLMKLLEARRSTLYRKQR
jgi:uncharacterized Zn finger protein